MISAGLIDRIIHKPTTTMKTLNREANKNNILVDVPVILTGRFMTFITYIVYLKKTEFGWCQHIPNNVCST